MWLADLIADVFILTKCSGALLRRPCGGCVQVDGRLRSFYFEMFSGEDSGLCSQRKQLLFVSK